MTALIFKIVRAAEWPEAGSYRGSAKDRADGFLHFSTAEQLEGTFTRYYSQERDLVLVAVDAGALGAALKFEPSSGGDLYPHLYADLALSAVKWVRPLGDGSVLQELQQGAEVAERVGDDERP